MALLAPPPASADYLSLHMPPMAEPSPYIASRSSLIVTGAGAFRKHGMRSAHCQALLVAIVVATAIIGTNADANSFFTNLGDTFKNAGQTIAQTAQTGYGVVKNETITAAQATGVSCFLNATDTCLTALLKSMESGCRVCTPS